jgi:hypothetical protein
MSMRPDRPHDPDERDIRQLFEHTLADEPSTAPPVQDDLGRGRRALRRRNTGVAFAAAAAVALVAGGIAYAPNLIGTASGPGFAGSGNAAATTSAPPTPRSTPKATATTKPSPNGNCGVAPPEGKVPCGPVRASFADVLEAHLGTEHFEATGVTGGPGDGAERHELAWNTWKDGKARGTVVAAVVTFDDQQEWIEAGPDGEPCAVRPVKTGPDPAFRWISCTSEKLPDGSTLRIAEGKDAYAKARAASLITEDGKVVSIATSTAYFERSAGDSEPSHEDFPARLAALPLTAEQLEAVVTDPRMLEP